MCIEVEQEVVKEAKCTSPVLLNTGEVFAPAKKLLRYSLLC